MSARTATVTAPTAASRSRQPTRPVPAPDEAPPRVLGHLARWCTDCGPARLASMTFRSVDDGAGWRCHRSAPTTAGSASTGPVAELAANLTANA